MPVKTLKMRGQYRVVEAGTRRLARSKHGKPVDGGGHGASKEKAQRQCSKINEYLQEKKGR